MIMIKKSEKRIATRKRTIIIIIMIIIMIMIIIIIMVNKWITVIMITKQ